MSSSQSAVLHADLDAFYASVEQRDDARLRGRPVIVGGGVVLAASYEAKAYGVRSAMGGRQALRLCPDAIVVNPRMPDYLAASRAVFDVFADTTPRVEGLSVDEAFLDVGGLRRLSGTPTVIARKLRHDVMRYVGLPISVGAAPTKFLAKVASAVAKPDGMIAVPPGTELDFLHPLPVERLWGVGRVTSGILRARGVRTVADAAALDVEQLVALVGKAAGRHLHALAHNRDPRPVRVGQRRRSIGAQHSLGRSEPTAADLDAMLLGLTDRVCRRLRKGGRTGRTATLRLRFDDYARTTRSHTLTEATDSTDVFVDVLRALMRDAEKLLAERGITLLGVAIGALTDAPMQLRLPYEGADAGALESTVDAVQAKFGSEAVTRAVQIGRRRGVEVPLLPD